MIGLLSSPAPLRRRLRFTWLGVIGRPLYGAASVRDVPSLATSKFSQHLLDTALVARPSFYGPAEYRPSDLKESGKQGGVVGHGLILSPISDAPPVMAA